MTEKNLAQQFAFNTKLSEILAEGMQSEDWSARPAGGGNSAHWILGHLCGARRSLLRKLGEDVPAADWESLFGMGVDTDDTTGFPPCSDLLADFTNLGGKLAVRLGTMSKEESAAPWGSAFPDGSDTLGGGARFLFFHESYHLGQIGLLRRMRGKQRFA